MAYRITSLKPERADANRLLALDRGRRGSRTGCTTSATSLLVRTPAASAATTPLGCSPRFATLCWGSFAPPRVPQHRRSAPKDRDAPLGRSTTPPQAELERTERTRSAAKSFRRRLLTGRSDAILVARRGQAAGTVLAPATLWLASYTGRWTIYNGLSRGRGLQAPGARDRQVSADAHRGTYRDHLRRHEVESADAAENSEREGSRLYADTAIPGPSTISSIPAYSLVA